MSRIQWRIIAPLTAVAGPGAVVGAVISEMLSPNGLTYLLMALVLSVGLDVIWR